MANEVRKRTWGLRGKTRSGYGGASRAGPMNGCVEAAECSSTLVFPFSLVSPWLCLSPLFQVVIRYIDKSVSSV